MKRFPKDFVWGVATSSYQIEGAAYEDGRGESIWDRFCQTPGKVDNFDNGDVANDHYHLYKEDVALMKGIGVDSYRFSIAWPRIFPSGEGKPNEKGMDFYKRLVESLLEKGITPAATMYHWDLPQLLQDKGGWCNRDTVYRFEEYAAYLYSQLGDTVPLWITHNEPWCASFLGYGNGHHAPGITDNHSAVKASHHLLLSHGLAVKAFRESGLSGQIGITLNLTATHPAFDRVEDVQAARTFDGYFNRWFMDPVLKGAYPDDMVSLYSRYKALDYILPGDLQAISAPIDFLGINYYSRGVVKANPNDKWLGVGHVPSTLPLTDMGWEIYPLGLYELLTRIAVEHPALPLYVTENGAAFPDRLEDGQVRDADRIEFLKAHFDEALRAIEAGVPLKGYYVWSLMDNFEWAFGYAKRFGIVHVDFETQKRTLKDSAKWYQQWIQTEKKAVDRELPEKKTS